jgi:transcriptional regulator with GAF, ATPase, and Fis domain
MSPPARRPAGAKASPADPTAGLDAPGAPFAPPRPYVVVFEGSSARSFLLPFAEETRVGRSEDCQVRLEDAGVSRIHLRIAMSPSGEAVLSDAGSQNGTLVNGARLAGTRVLVAGDVVELGATALVFHGSAATSTGPTVAPREVRVVDAGATKMLVADPAMMRLTDLLQRVAKADLTVLVVGETGVGKELVAAAIHAASPRRARPFLAINCAAVQDSIFESELFGYERGAFTGAAQAKPGLLEVASGGTVFLDEVGELSAVAQAKLLRALDAKKVIRVGGLEERPIDVRIVAATNRDLPDEVERGRFRQDLYFRMSGATLWLPPLRDRPRELEALARAFLDDACQRLARPTPAIEESFWARLRAHPFPGNVRELKNVIDFVAATMLDGEAIGAKHVEERLGSPRVARAAPVADAPAVPVAHGPAFRPIDEEVRELEKGRMVAALLAANGNQKRAAELIGMPLRTFVTKLKQYDLRDKTHGST